MNARAILCLLALLPLGAVGPSGTAAAPLPMPEGSRLAAEVCVPPGLPPYREWTAERAFPRVSIDTLRRPVLVVWVSYGARGQKLTAFWRGVALAMVDAAPDQPEALPWLDEGLVTPGGLFIADGAPSCRWGKASPLPALPGGEAT